MVLTFRLDGGGACEPAAAEQSYMNAQGIEPRDWSNSPGYGSMITGHFHMI